MHLDPASRAVMMAWQIEEVGSFCSIHVAKNSFMLFEEISTYITSYAEMLIDNHYEEINLSELELIHEEFGDGEYPADGWNAGDVRELLFRLISDHKKYLKKHPIGSSILGRWNELLLQIIEMWDYDVDDYLVFPIEGSLLDFTNVLVNYYQSGRLVDKLTDVQEGKWFVTLKRIVGRDEWWTEISNRRQLYKLFEEFNDRYELHL